MAQTATNGDGAGALPPVALIAGIGQGLGVALARVFAEAGHDVVGLARSRAVADEATQAVSGTGRQYAHVSVDLTDSGDAAAALAPISYRVAVVIYNAHRLVIAPFSEIRTEDFENAWRVNCLGAVHVAQALLPAMVARRAGTMVFTGATASVRGGARFAALASSKFALRALAQSLAREFGPQGIHVGHVVIDGAIDEPQTDARFGVSEAGRLDPEAVAHAYLNLCRQHPSAWTHEIDLRPASERF